MIKNRLVQVIYQVVYCTLAIFGILGSLGYFNRSFNYDFYAYYTNLSNFVCMGVVVAALIQTVKKAKHNEDGFVQTAPSFTILSVILILVTFLVYNILLAKENTVQDYFLSPSNLLMHVILPVMFILHWVLFYEHGKMRWYHPLMCTVMPLIYVAFILVRAAILKNVQGAMLYPYFFLNVDKLGWGGFFAWLSILVVLFVIIGYIFFFFDNFKYFKGKIISLINRIKSKGGKTENTQNTQTAEIAASDESEE